ncbi:ribonuclease HII [Galbibacter sp.]|jgi:hypothetical protein|uniref:ribonuclease HII n=1 Tax=Galbibacter sp. TaxID=2918471 RepID=UPI003A90905D
MKYFFGIILIVCLGFHSCQEAVIPVSDIIHYTPRKAAVVIKINDFQAFKSELINNDFLELTKGSNAYLDSKSLLSTLSYIQTKDPSLLAINEIGKGNYDYTFITKKHNELFSIDSTVNRTIETLTYESASIRVLTIDKHKVYSTFFKNYFIGSSSKLIIENLIRSQGDLKADPSLVKLFEVAQNNSSANIFVNHKQGENLFSTVLSGPLANEVTQLNDWTSFDSKITQDYIKLNGVALNNPGSKNTLDLVTNTTPATSEGADIVPINADYFISLNSENSGLVENKNTTDSLFYNSRELLKIGISDQQIFAVSTSDNLDFEDRLQKYVKDQGDFRDFVIWNLNDSTVVSKHYPKLFPKIKSKHVAKVGSFYVFTNAMEPLESMITNFQNNATLAQLSSYKTLRNELAGESSILVIGNLNKIKGNKAILNDNFKDYFSEKDLGEYKFIAFQYIAEGDFAHFHTLLKKANTSTVNSNLITQIFSTILDAEVATNPQFVLNHYTKKKEIVVQDVENNLYLISTEGKVLWKKKLDSKIRGEITQVDLYRNGRLQLAFTTASKLMIVDRNGKDVSPFPIEFKGTITQPLSVFDYSKTKDYRFVVVMDQDVKMYDRNGKSVNGFTFRKAKNSIINNPKHIRIGSKDYLIFQESNGKLDILHRTGDVRINVKGTIDFSGNQVYLYDGKFTTTNADGDLIQIDQNGGINKLELNLKDQHLIDATTKTLASISENVLTIKDNSTTLDFGIYTLPKIYYINDVIYVTTTDLQTNKVYLFNSDAELMENFPVFGDSRIDLDDMDNDNKLEMVTKGDNNSVICYKIN